MLCENVYKENLQGWKVTEPLKNPSQDMSIAAQVNIGSNTRTSLFWLHNFLEHSQK